MCFSAEADFVSGAVIGAVGIATLSQVDDHRELPLAALPITFAAHQATQGFVWLGLDGQVSSTTYDVALGAYLLVAWVVLPLLAPLAVFLVEPDAMRRRWLASLTVLGALAGAALLPPILAGDVSAEINGHTLRYLGAGDHSTAITVVYVIATCGSFLVSSVRRVQIFGVANVAAVALLVWIESSALTSVWCTWAAIVSVLIWAEISDRRRRRPADAVRNPAASV